MAKKNKSGKKNARAAKPVEIAADEIEEVGGGSMIDGAIVYTTTIALAAAITLVIMAKNAVYPT